MRLAAGPLTNKGAPEIAPTAMPPMIPVTIPRSADTPQATAMPMQSGNATRKTTMDANTSASQLLRPARRGGGEVDVRVRYRL